MKADFPSFRTTEILFTSPIKKNNKTIYSASTNHSNNLQLCINKNNLYRDAYKKQNNYFIFQLLFRRKFSSSPLNISLYCIKKKKKTLK